MKVIRMFNFDIIIKIDKILKRIRVLKNQAD